MLGQQAQKRVDVSRFIASAPEGLEHSAKSTGKTGFSDLGGAECGALGAGLAPIGADLQAIIDAWPALPEALRAGILAMIQAAERSG